MSGQVVHVWGLLYDDGSRQPPSGVAVSGVSAFETYRAIAGNVTHFGGVVANRTTTRDLGGLMVGADFETPPNDGRYAMWHSVMRTSDPWRDPTEATR